MRPRHFAGAGLLAEGILCRAAIQLLVFNSFTGHQCLLEGSLLGKITNSLDFQKLMCSKCGLETFFLIEHHLIEQTFCVMLISSGYESERKKRNLVLGRKAVIGRRLFSGKAIYTLVLLVVSHHL